MFCVSVYELRIVTCVLCGLSTRMCGYGGGCWDSKDPRRKAIDRNKRDLNSDLCCETYTHTRVCTHVRLTKLETETLEDLSGSRLKTGKKKDSGTSCVGEGLGVKGVDVFLVLLRVRGPYDTRNSPQAKRVRRTWGYPGVWVGRGVYQCVGRYLWGG